MLTYKELKMYIEFNNELKLLTKPFDSIKRTDKIEFKCEQHESNKITVARFTDKKREFKVEHAPLIFCSDCKKDSNKKTLAEKRGSECYYNSIEFLKENNFNMITTKKEFNSGSRIKFKCLLCNEPRDLSINSFKNLRHKKLSKGESHCTKCNENKKYEQYKKEIKAINNHNVIEVIDNTTVRYNCGECGEENQTSKSNLERNSKYCLNCMNNINKATYEQTVDELNKKDIILRLTKEEYNNSYLSRRQKLPIICSCGSNAEMSRADINRGRKCNDCVLDRRGNTNIEKYGTKNVMHNDVIRKRWKESLLNYKELTLPSGKKIQYQGFEDRCIDYLLKTKKVKETSLFFGEQIPIFSYILENKYHEYHPDIYIKNKTKDKTKDIIIEVKSTFTYNLDPLKCNTKLITVSNKKVPGTDINYIGYMYIYTDNDLYDIVRYENGQYKSKKIKDISAKIID